MKIESNSPIGKKIWNYVFGCAKVKIVEKVYDEFLENEDVEKIIVNHELDLDHDKLFADKIEDSIAYLTKLKDKGYSSVEERWAGYEDNYFVAVKIEKETDDEFALRIAKAIELRIEMEVNEEEKQRKIDKQIEELQDKIKKLQNQKGE